MGHKKHVAQNNDSLRPLFRNDRKALFELLWVTRIDGQYQNAAGLSCGMDRVKRCLRNRIIRIKQNRYASQLGDNGSQNLDVFTADVGDDIDEASDIASRSSETLRKTAADRINHGRANNGNGGSCLLYRSGCGVTNRN